MKENNTNYPLQSKILVIRNERELNTVIATYGQYPVLTFDFIKLMLQVGVFLEALAAASSFTVVTMTASKPMVQKHKQTRCSMRVTLYMGLCVHLQGSGAGALRVGGMPPV